MSLNSPFTHASRGRRRGAGYRARAGLAAVLATLLVMAASPSAFATHPVDQGETSDLYTITPQSGAVVEDDAGARSYSFTVNRKIGEGGKVPPLSAGTLTDRVTYRIEGGTAGTDFCDAGGDCASGAIEFEGTETTKTISITINGDNEVEADETLRLIIQPEAFDSCADCDATLTIVNDDVQATVSDAAVVEGTQDDGQPTTTALFTVRLSQALSRPVTLAYSTRNGTAVAGQDYVPESGTVTFAPGDLEEDITVEVVPDRADEADENFFVDISNTNESTNASGQPVNDIDIDVTDATGEGLIRDDEGVRPGITITNVLVQEGNPSADGSTSTRPTATFTVRLTEPSPFPVTVDYSTRDGSAIAGRDYEQKSGTVTFAAGRLEQTIDVIVLPDSLNEMDENLFVDLRNVRNGSILDPSGEAIIQDDDSPGPVFRVSDAAVQEGNSGSTVAEFVVTLDPASGQVTTVDFATEEAPDRNPATEGQDFQSREGTLTFNSGETRKTILVPVNGDVRPEADEQFILRLSNPTGGAEIGNFDGVGTILDEDGPPPTLAISGDQSSGEGDGGTTAYTFTVTRSGFTGPISVGYGTRENTAFEGEDYEAQSGRLDFAAGETSKEITVVVNGDTTPEDDESFDVVLFDPRDAVIGDDGEATAVIENDDQPPLPTLSVSDVTVTEGNSGTKNADFTVRLSSPSGQTITVEYATSPGSATTGSDYTATSGRLTFAPGDQEETVTVEVIGDTRDELSETFTLALSRPMNADIADGTGTGTITDDDPAPSLSVGDVTVTEGDTAAVSATFTVTLSPASEQEVTVQYTTSDGSAAAPSDYTTTSGTLTFAPGQTTKTVTVTVNGDTFDELNETFSLVLLENPSNATVTDGRGTATITDNDGAPSLSVSDVAVTERDTGTVVATFSVTLAPASDRQVTVQYTTANGSATAPADYTATSGTLTFAAGETTKSVAVTVNGDTVDEPNETFDLVLSSPSNATVTDGTGRATITDNDDPAPPDEEDPDEVDESSGYRFVAADGGAFVFGERAFHGSLGDQRLNKPIVGGATNVKTYDGYWMVASDGGVFNFGDAGFFGSLGGESLDAPIVEIEPTPTGRGYFLVDAKGRVFPFGDAARNIPDARGLNLNKAIIGMSVTSTGQGYWLVASDGGIFSFGDAKFFGSMGDAKLNQPVIDIAPTPDSNGYYLVAADGGIFSFGNAEFKGSTGNITLNKPAVAMLVAPNGAGYWIVASDGGVFTYGAVPFHGSTGDIRLNSPVLDAIH